MIVRIAGEGQYRIGSSALDRLDEIDHRLMEAVELGNSEDFCRLLSEMHELVYNEGTPVPVEEIVESNLVLPSSDTTLEEARHLFDRGGLISG
jgi:hypothetical protein